MYLVRSEFHTSLPCKTLCGVYVLWAMAIAPLCAQDHVILQEGRSSVRSIRFAPDGQRLATTGDPQGESVNLWSVPKQNVLAELKGHHGTCRALAFSPDGELLATVRSADFSPFGVCGPSEILLWNVSTRRQVDVLRGHVTPIDALEFSPDGKFLAGAEGGKGTSIIWNVQSKKPQFKIPHGAHDLSFSPDGKLLVLANIRSLRVWNMKTRKEHAALDDVQRGVCAKFSPDGDLLAVAQREDGAWSPARVTLWSVKTGEKLRTMKGHTGPINGLSFSSDGAYLASVGTAQPANRGHVPGAVKLWEVQSGRHVADLKGHNGRVYSVDFSPDDRLLATGSGDMTVRLWDLSPYIGMDQ